MLKRFGFQPQKVLNRKRINSGESTGSETDVSHCSCVAVSPANEVSTRSLRHTGSVSEVLQITAMLTSEHAAFRRIKGEQ